MLTEKPQRKWVESRPVIAEKGGEGGEEKDVLAAAYLQPGAFSAA